MKDFCGTPIRPVAMATMFNPWLVPELRETGSVDAGLPPLGKDVINEASSFCAQAMSYRLPRKALLGMLTACLLAGCVFLPQAEEEDEAAQCHLSTASFSLQAVPANTNINISGCSNDATCVIAELAIVPVGSFIVSGSIVAVGNTAHWIEAQGRCSDSQTRRAIRHLLATTSAAGGQVLRTSADAMAWLKRFSPKAASTARPEHS